MSKALSRRAFFRGPAGPKSKAARTLPLRRRPPGALPEAAFLASCTACGDCVRACPHNAVHTLVDTVELGPGTPVLLPDQRPCHMCEGFPCVQACDEGALSVPIDGAWPLGRVEVDPSACLPFRGPECGACAGLCPEGVDALAMVGTRPTIDAAACVGCGLCIQACPTRPKALHLLALGSD